MENVIDSDVQTAYIKRRLVLKRRDPGEEVRCTGCGFLLYKVLYKSSGTVVEIKCAKCSTFNRNL